MDLTSTINYYKNQFDPMMFQDVIDKIEDVEYLSYLDFEDLKNLCQSNKKFKYICTNEAFRKILSYKNIVIPKNINVYDMINEINIKIVALLHDHYPNIPRYVNKELFF